MTDTRPDDQNVIAHVALYSSSPFIQHSSDPNRTDERCWPGVHTAATFYFRDGEPYIGRKITTEDGDTVSAYVSQHGKVTVQVIGSNCSNHDVEVIASFTPGELTALLDVLSLFGAKVDRPERPTDPDHSLTLARTQQTTSEDPGEATA